MQLEKVKCNLEQGIVVMSSYSLPDINAPPPGQRREPRSEEQQAALDAAVSDVLKVVRVQEGEALSTALKPPLDCPTPRFEFAATSPPAESPGETDGQGCKIASSHAGIPGGAPRDPEEARVLGVSPSLLAEEAASADGPSAWELFPPPERDCVRLFAPGQRVWVLMDGKPFAQAQVVELVSQGEFKGRYRVRYGDGSHYHCRRGRLCPLYGTPVGVSDGTPGGTPGLGDRPTVVVCPETKHYRQLGRLQPRPGEQALEIGSDLGACTELLAESVGGAGHACGVDKSAESVKEAKRRYPDLKFVCADVLRNPGILGIIRDEAGGSYNAVFIDINGNRAAEAVAEVIQLARTALAPRLIVVKSTEMTRILEKAMQAHDRN